MSNTVSVGQTANTTTVSPDPSIERNPQYITISRLLKTHLQESTNQYNSDAGYGKGIQALSRAFDMVINIGKEWAYDTLYNYFVTNASTSCREDTALRGIDTISGDTTRLVSMYNLFRGKSEGYPNGVSDDTYIQAIGDVNIVLWATGS